MDLPLEIVYHHIFPLVKNKSLILVSQYCYRKHKERLYLGVELDTDKFTNWCKSNDIAAASKFISYSLVRHWSTMLKIACDNTNDIIVSILLSYPVDIDGKYCLTAACHGEKIYILNMLLSDNRFAIDNYMLFSSVAMNKLKTMSVLLIDPRVDPSFNDNALYKYCLDNNLVDMAELLMLDIGVQTLRIGRPIRHYLIMEYPLGTANVICQIKYGRVSMWKGIVVTLSHIASTYIGRRYRNEYMTVGNTIFKDVVYMSKTEVEELFTYLQVDIPPLVKHQLVAK